MSVAVNVTGVDSIGIEVTGIRDVLAFFAKYDVQARLLDLAEKLCKVGEPIIQAKHGHHAKIDIVPTANGYLLQAEGDDILFIEFGTGDKAGELAFSYDQVPAVVRPGSWSEAHQGEYWKTGGFGKGYWHFNGVEYHETEPHPAFYYAYVAMIQALDQIAVKVFSA